DSGRGGPRDRVVTADDERDDATAGHLAHALVDRGPGQLPHSVARDGVTVIDDLEVVEDLDAEIEVIGTGVVRVGPEGTWAETGARPEGRVVVPRGANDRDIGLPRVELLGLGQQWAHPEGCWPDVGLRVKLRAKARRDGAVGLWHPSPYRHDRGAQQLEAANNGGDELLLHIEGLEGAP